MIRISSPLGRDLRITGFRGTERISGLFSFDLELLSDRTSISPGELIGKAVTVSVERTDGGERHFHGYISRLAYEGKGPRKSMYRATMVPAAWFLSKTKDSRIFQGLNVVEIVREVAKDHPELQLEDSGLRRTYPHLEYCVQYQESDLNFVLRLLEGAGIFFFFAHSAKAHTMVLGDSSSAYRASAEPELSYASHEGRPDHADIITEWKHSWEYQSGAFAVGDYNFELKSPERNLITEVAGRPVVPAGRNSEVFEYPAGQRTPSEGNDLGGVRAQEQDSATERVEAKSVCRSWTAGCFFTLTSHASLAETGLKYVVSEVYHEVHSPDLTAGGEQPPFLYQNTGVCLPHLVAFRPPRITKTPTIPGAQTAEVVGPPGMEIYTDAHARIQVKFHWDRAPGRRDGSSCFIRVAQATAGRGWGTLALPRIGHEVLVHFLEGDPSRPLVMGSLYNADNPPPCSHAGRTAEEAPPPPTAVEAAMMTTLRSNSLGGSGGHNEITMNDTGGSEGLYIKAQHNEIHEVGNDRKDTVGNDETSTVKHDRVDKVENDETLTVLGHRRETVEKTETVDITQSRTHTVGEDDSLTVKGSRSETIQKMQNVTVLLSSTETVLVAKALSTGGAYGIQVGAAMNTFVVGMQTEQVGTVKKVSVGDKLEFTCGASKLVLESNGKVTIHGTEFDFTASGPVKINGAIIDLN